MVVSGIDRRPKKINVNWSLSNDDVTLDSHTHFTLAGRNVTLTAPVRLFPPNQQYKTN